MRALGLGADSDGLNGRADDLLSLAEVQPAAGNHDEADEAAAEALRLYRLEGNAVAPANAALT
jgi:hypothetical protein